MTEIQHPKTFRRPVLARLSALQISFKRMPTQMSIPELPLELIRAVIERLPIVFLLPVLLSCRTFHAIAEPFLYYHVDLSDQLARSALFCRTILGRPKLANFIHTLILSDPYWRRKGTRGGVFHPKSPFRNRPERFNAYNEALKRTMTQAVNVKALSLDIIQGAEAYIPIRFPHLWRVEKLRVNVRFPWNFIGHELLLSSLSQLTHLELPSTSSYYSSAAIRNNYLPLLEELVCPGNFAIKLAPGKPLQRLFVTLPVSETMPPDLMYRLAQTKTTVKVLGLSVGLGWNWEAGVAEIVDDAIEAFPEMEEVYFRLHFNSRQRQDLIALFQRVSTQKTRPGYHLTDRSDAYITFSSSLSANIEPERMGGDRRSVPRSWPGRNELNVYDHPTNLGI